MEIVELGMLDARTRKGCWLAAAGARGPAARGARAVPTHVGVAEQEAVGAAR